MEQTTVDRGQQTGLALVLETKGTQRIWLARKIGVSPSQITRWASGERRIPQRYIDSLASALGVSPDEIR